MTQHANSSVPRYVTTPGPNGIPQVSREEFERVDQARYEFGQVILAQPWARDICERATFDTAEVLEAVGFFVRWDAVRFETHHDWLYAVMDVQDENGGPPLELVTQFRADTLPSVFGRAQVCVQLRTARGPLQAPAPLGALVAADCLPASAAQPAMADEPDALNALGAYLRPHFEAQRGEPTKKAAYWLAWKVGKSLAR